MSLFIESENSIRRSYELTGPVKTYNSDRAVIEIVPSKLFGEMLYIDGCLQLARKDEYIYHEMLVHPTMAHAVSRSSVCILGGGDGCALREVLKWPDVKEVTVIDWDSRLVYLFQGQYASWNSQSFHDPRVKLEIADIMSLQGQKRQYDVILVDLLDPDCADKKNMIFWDELTELARSWTHSQTVVTFNAGGFLPWNTATLECLTRELRYEWEGSKSLELAAYHVFVPSYTNEWCLFMVRPCDKMVDWSLLNPTSIRYFDENAWILANLWTKDCSALIPKKPVNLSNWAAPL